MPVIELDKLADALGPRLTLTIDQLPQKLITKIRVFGRFQQELAGLTPD
jgi:hypothetical protein